MTPVGVACCLVDPRRGSPKPTKQRVSGGVSRAPSAAWVGGLTGGEGAEGPGALVRQVGLPHLPGPPGSSFWAGTVSVLWLWVWLWPGSHGCLKRCVEDSEATGKMSALHWQCPPPAAGGSPLCAYLPLPQSWQETHSYLLGQAAPGHGEARGTAGRGDQEGTCPSCAWSSARDASGTHLSDQHPIPGLLRHFGLICSLSLLSSPPHDWLPAIQPFWHGGHWAQSAPCLSCGLRSNPGGRERLSHLSVVTLQVLAIKLDL